MKKIATTILIAVMVILFTAAIYGAMYVIALS